MLAMSLKVCESCTIKVGSLDQLKASCISLAAESEPNVEPRRDMFGLWDAGEQLAPSNLEDHAWLGQYPLPLPEAEERMVSSGELSRSWHWGIAVAGSGIQGTFSNGDSRGGADCCMANAIGSSCDSWTNRSRVEKDC